MNFAISTLVILYLILPGLAYRRFYYTEEFSKEYIKQDLFSLFISTFIPAIFVHALTIGIVSWFGYEIDFRILGQIMTSKGYPKLAFENLQQNAPNILIYTALSLFYAVLLGVVAKWIIRKLRLDHKFKLFRYQNHWHYIIRGEFFNFPKAAFDLQKDDVNDIEFTFVDALVETPEGTLIYDGILVNYELSRDGGLKNIQLSNVKRRYVHQDSQNKSDHNAQETVDYLYTTDSIRFNAEAASIENNYYDIPGHILILPYDRVLNLNFTYYKLNELDDDTIEVRRVE